MFKNIKNTIIVVLVSALVTSISYTWVASRRANKLNSQLQVAEANIAILVNNRQLSYKAFIAMQKRKAKLNKSVVKAKAKVRKTARKNNDKLPLAIRQSLEVVQ